VTAQSDAENAVIEYLMQQHGKDRAWASNFLHRGLVNYWFANAEPELRQLVGNYLNAARGHGG
jgi:hypothetical protein